MSEIPFRESGRHTPTKGVHVSPQGPNWVFLTVCTEKRGQWLAQASVQRALDEIWRHRATAWLVSDYLLMPDHLHLFCAPHDFKFTIERWIGFWKDRFAKTHPDTGTFQPGGFHHRLRDGESYAQKWQYVRENRQRARTIGRIPVACTKFVGPVIENYGGTRCRDAPILNHPFNRLHARDRNTADPKTCLPKP